MNIRSVGFFPIAPHVSFQRLPNHTNLFHLVQCWLKQRNLERGYQQSVFAQYSVAH